LRVIAGKAKKRRLKSPGAGLAVRPTADRVKEALFNILGGRVAGCRFADLYAGTGGVGIEALSRGAQKVVFVEKNRRVGRLLRENITLTGLQDGAEIMLCSVEEALRLLLNRREVFDIIFADPPYRQGLAEDTLNMLSKQAILRADGILALETGADEVLPVQTEGFTMWRREKYGDTTLVFYKTEVKEEIWCE